MLPERFLIAGVEQARRWPPCLTHCESQKSDDWHVDHQLPNGGTEIGRLRVRTPD
jgi:hypothetical protein